MPQKIQVMNVRLPGDIVKWLDSLVEREIYGSRSEAIRDFLRDYLGANR
jgi:Arc/MetJ-type ribon-helix-helix transcriptional regulator